MTKEEIMASEKDPLTPADIAPILKCDPQLIRIAARDPKQGYLSFPVDIVGNRVKIPRMPFIKSRGWA